MENIKQKNIYEKLALVQEEVGTMQKDTKGYNYKYFDINQLLEKLQPILKKHNLAVFQPIIDNSVMTIIMDVSGYQNAFGSEMKSSIKLPEGVKPQDMGSAITYYRRYSLVSLLAIQAEDDDGAKATKTGVKEAVKQLEEDNDIGF